MKYPLGIQTFSQIRSGGYVYLDKTELMYDLIANGKVYFLARPRRFGKSLLVSTFESLFAGDKSLFDGLSIASTDYPFKSHPVIVFEFSNVQVNCAEDLKQYIVNTTNRFAEQFEVELTIDSYEQRFGELVRKVHQKTTKEVVLLVDEYDKPILDNLFSDKLTSLKAVMSSFYAVAKLLDKHLHFVFITGVSKFAKVSVFSGMNNLTDISTDRRYATLCGVTQAELESNFATSIEKLAQLEQLSRPQMLAKIKLWYNGYQFHHQGQGVYNPYSLLSVFSKQEFKNFWFATATPTFLLDLLQTKQYELSNLTDFEVDEEAFEACEPEEMGVQSVFLQTGYLTIKDYNDPLYTLDFPNFEVKKSFYSSVATRYGKLEKGQGVAFVTKLVQQLQSQQFESFFDTLSVFFANIPNNISLSHEKYYQSLFYAIFKLIGLSIEVEINTNNGRIDCVIETSTMICIIEFKLNGTKEDALQQIIDKQYGQKYQQQGKPLILIGVAFDKTSRNIGGYKLQKGL